ncbi:MAG: hypothetical protein AB7O43_15935 [Hyphomicrobiaceae bacterium]
MPARTVRAREPGAQRGDIRFVSPDHFLVFRDVGLRGRRLDGHEDLAWKGRHGERNALFAELLVTTGLRLEEVASLLAIELPAADRSPSAQKPVPFRLPASIAKDGRAREVRIPVRLLRRFADYMAIERANALDSCRHPVFEPIVVGNEPDRVTVAMADDAGIVKIAALRGRENEELRALRTANNRMAQHIQALNLLVGELERRIAQLQADSPPDSLRVVPLVVPTSR